MARLQPQHLRLRLMAVGGLLAILLGRCGGESKKSAGQRPPPESRIIGLPADWNGTTDWQGSQWEIEE